MKKTLLLTLVGVVGLTGVSWGQINPDDGYFYSSNLVIDTINNTQGVPDPAAPDSPALNINGKFVLSDEPNECGRWNTKPHYRLESNPNVRYVYSVDGDLAYWMLIAYTDSERTEIAEWNSTDIVFNMAANQNTDYPWEATSWVNEGISTLAGAEAWSNGDYSSFFSAYDSNNPSTLLFLGQAEALTRDLEFNNGQWTARQ